jgi:hypothetical protein
MKRKPEQRAAMILYRSLTARVSFSRKFESFCDRAATAEFLSHALLISGAAMLAPGRFCCKSPFALVIKNSPGFRRDFRVKMWETSSPDDKLTGDLGNVIETVKIGGRGSDRLMARKLSPSNFGLLQQYRHLASFAAVHKISTRWRLLRT